MVTVAGSRRQTFEVPDRPDAQPPMEGEGAGVVEELRQARVRAFVLGTPILVCWVHGSRSAPSGNERSLKRLEAGHGAWQSPAVGQGGLQPPVPEDAVAKHLLRRGRQLGQPRAAKFPPGHLNRMPLVAADAWRSGSFDGCPAGGTRGLAEFWSPSTQRGPPADSCGAQLADTTDSAAARTKSADGSGNYPEVVTQTLRQKMARALRSDPSRTGCCRIGSFGDSARSGTMLLRLGRRYGESGRSDRAQFMWHLPDRWRR